MATLIWLSNDPADISGYKKAYIGSRGPNSSTTVSTAVTDTVAGILTTTTAMTLTAGGTTAKWITAPLKAAVTVDDRPTFNIWAKESNASANALVAIGLHQYTSSEQSAFLTSSCGVELGTSIARVVWTSSTAAGRETITSTAFAAGDRLVVAPVLGANGGTMGGSQTVTLDYNGATPAADGDSYVMIEELLEAQESQIANGDVVAIAGGPSLIAFEDLLKRMDPVVAELGSPDITWRDLENELGYQRDLQGS